MKLNLGCGKDKIQGFVNVDKYPTSATDLVYDLETFPWPWASNSVDEIVLKHALEHLGQDTKVFLKVMQELYRVCKHKTLIKITAPHPKHIDFLSDPTHVRPITMELFRPFSLGIVEEWQRQGLPGTPLAKYLGVDFVTTYYRLYFDSQWKGAKEGEALEEATRLYNNVVQAIELHLEVQKPQPIYVLTRHHGMGDVAMALCAAHAIKQATGALVILITSPLYEAMVQACPWVDYVVTDGTSEAIVKHLLDDPTAKKVDLGPAYFGINPLHQVDAYLKAFDLTCPDSDKSLELNLPTSVDAIRSQKRVLLFTGGSDLNRTLSTTTWEAIAQGLIDEQYEVMLIGRDDDVWKNPALDIMGVIDARNKFSVLETVALMRESDILISCDSGPIQLAGASVEGI